LTDPNPLPDFPIAERIPVRWGDMDAFAHVNNTVFFQYFEVARIAYFDAIGYREEMEATGRGPILAETSCRFRRPLTFPDTVTVAARVPDVGEDRFVMEYRIWSDSQQTVAAKGEGLIVSFDYRGGARCALPEEIRAAIARVEARTGRP